MIRQPSCSNAFTLTELMISIAMSLLLMIGIQQVFRYTSDAVGSGQALLTLGRDARAVEKILHEDFSQIALNDGTPLIIRSQRLSAFHSAKDAAADRDYSSAATNAQIDKNIRTIDLNNNNTEGETTVAGEIIPRTRYGFRNYRVDQLRFFIRGQFRRQTGNDGTFVAPMISNEACVWYGHLKQPTASIPPPNSLAGSKNPGWTPDTLDFSSGTPNTIATNPNNFYARQWAFGRNLMLLKEPVVVDPASPPPQAVQITDDLGAPQYFIGRDNTGPAFDDYGNPVAPDPDRFPPLSQLSRATLDNLTFAIPHIQWSRFDLAGTTIERYRTDILIPFVTANPNLEWWDRSTSAKLIFRFAGWPFPTRPHTSEGLARTLPVLLQNCTGVIVEYAGDFVAQDAAGTVTGVFGYSYDDGAGTIVRVYPGNTDNVIDYFVEPATGTRRIRWYGFPRDVGGTTAANSGKPDGVIEGWGNSTAGSGRTNNQMPDVVPLRDVMRQFVMPLLTAPARFIGAPFERIETPVYVKDPVTGMWIWSGTWNNYLAVKNDYGTTTESGIAAQISLNARYDAVWGPDTIAAPLPKLIRFTLTFEDPNGRLAEPRRVEYVVRVQ